MCLVDTDREVDSMEVIAQSDDFREFCRVCTLGQCAIL